MSDLRTARQRLLRILKLDSVTSGNLAETDADIALIDSMNFNKKFVFWFNKISGKISTQAEKMRYKLPFDYISMVGQPMYNSFSTESATRRKLTYRPLEWCEENKFRGAETEMTINTGSAEFYSIDETNQELLLIPVPFTNGETVEFLYVSDCDIPGYYHDGSTWLFHEKSSRTKTLGADFSNAWLQHAPNLIIYKAASDLMFGYHGGEDTFNMGQNYQRMWAEELNAKRAENSARSASKAVTPHI